MAILQKSEFIFVPFNRLSNILPPLKYYIKYIIHKISEIVPPQIAFLNLVSAVNTEVLRAK